MAGDLYSRFSRSFSQFAGRVFIDSGERSWTYGDIEREAGRLAARLQGLAQDLNSYNYQCRYLL